MTLPCFALPWAQHLLKIRVSFDFSFELHVDVECPCCTWPILMTHYSHLKVEGATNKSDWIAGLGFSAVFKLHHA